MPCFATIAQSAGQKNSTAEQGLKTVIIRAVIGVDGVPFHPLVVQGIDEAKDQASLEAVGKWRFRPAMRNGKAVPVVTEVQLDFDPRAEKPVTPQLSESHGLRMKAAEQNDALLDYYVSCAEAGDTESQVEASRQLSEKRSRAEDLMGASAWAIIAAKAGSREAAKFRSKVEKRMTADQIDAAGRAADAWRPGSVLRLQ